MSVSFNPAGQKAPQSLQGKPNPNVELQEYMQLHPEVSRSKAIEILKQKHGGEDPQQPPPPPGVGNNFCCIA